MVSGRAAMFSPQLVFACIIVGFGTLLYGYDGSSFGGMQSLPSFAKEFGVQNPKTGAYALTTGTASLLNSIAYIGKGVGALIGAYIVEYLGHKWCLVALSVCGIVGTVVQITAHSVAQFAVSRVILYGAIGLVEVGAGTYQAEIVPAPIRGMVVASLQLLQSPGGLIASGMNRVYYKDTTYRIWRIPSSIQVVWPSIILLGVYFIPASPRWLLAKGRRDDALKNLIRIRGKKHADACVDEIEALQADIDARRDVKTGWLDLFRGNNRRRTLLASGVWIFQQATGQTFVSSYAVPFWISAGLGSNAFNYQLGLSAAGFVGILIGTQCYDRVGRRPVLMFGAIGMGAIFFSMAGMGLNPPYTHEQGLGMVALVIMFAPTFVATWGALSYVVGSELGSGPLREKTMAFGAAINVVFQWLTTFVTPYILNAIHARVGFIYGSICFAAAVWVFIYLPETRNRSLEEIDEMFHAGLPARQWSKYECVGIGAQIARLEGGQIGDVEGDADTTSSKEKATTNVAPVVKAQ